MGIEGVVLEDHGDIPVLGGHIVHHPVADEKLAVADILQAGNHPQGGGFAAAGRTHQDDKFLVLDFQVQVRNNGDAAGIGFSYVLKGDAGHGVLLPIHFSGNFMMYNRIGQGDKPLSISCDYQNITWQKG